MSPAPVRILHLFGAMNRGGAELRTLDVMRHIDRTRFQLEFCALSGREGVLDAEVRRLGGEVHLLALGPRFPLAFLRLLRERRIDALHSHVHLFSGALLALAAQKGVRIRIAHFRSTGDTHPGAWWRTPYRMVMRTLVRRYATDILACGTAVMREAWSRDWSRDPRCRVIHNGVEAGAFAAFDGPHTRDAVRQELGLSRTATVVLVVGRFDVLKNQRRAVDIVARFPDAHLVFAGRGDNSELTATRARVAALGIANRTHFLGERDDIPRLLCAADVLLLTSWQEGLPGAVLEAVAAGTPVVSSDVAGSHEILEALPGSGVIVRLEAPDETWVRVLANAVTSSRAPEFRVRARAAFSLSVFSLEASVRALSEVWHRASLEQSTARDASEHQSAP